MTGTAPMLSNVDDLVTGRRSVRRFSSPAIDEEQIRELLRLALWAPSPHNSQPWRFTILRPAARHQIAQAMADRLREELSEDGLSSDQIVAQAERSYARITSAPAAVLCSLVHQGLVEYPDARRNDLEFAMAVQSVGAVLQTLFLLAWDRGIGTCWMAAPMYCQDVVRSVLRLPLDFEPQALVLLGYYEHAPRVRERLALESLIDVR